MSPPILSAPPLHFLVVDFTVTCGTNKLTFVAYTDAPCHLWLHLTTEEPIIRRIPYKKRGGDFTASSLTCFVELDLIEQDEAGDTTTHTFTVPLAAYDMDHYWYLTGTQGGVPLESVSQVFRAACSVPSAPVTCCKADAQCPTCSVVLMFCEQYSYAICPTTSFTAKTLTLWIKVRSGAYPVPVTTVDFWTAGSNAMPLVHLFSTYADTSWVRTSFVPVEFALPDYPIVGGSYYAFVPWFENPYTSRLYTRLYVRACINDTCPHPRPANSRVYLRNCYRGDWRPCNCAGRPWNLTVNPGHQYDLEGVPQ